MATSVINNNYLKYIDQTITITTSVSGGGNFENIKANGALSITKNNIRCISLIYSDTRLSGLVLAYIDNDNYPYFSGIFNRGGGDTTFTLRIAYY